MKILNNLHCLLLAAIFSTAFVQAQDKENSFSLVGQNGYSLRQLQKVATLVKPFAYFSQYGQSKSLRDIIVDKLQGNNERIKFQQLRYGTIPKLSYELYAYGKLMHKHFEKNFGITMDNYLQQYCTDPVLINQYEQTNGFLNELALVLQMASESEVSNFSEMLLIAFDGLKFYTKREEIRRGEDVELMTLGRDNNALGIQKTKAGKIRLSFKGLKMDLGKNKQEEDLSQKQVVCIGCEVSEAIYFNPYLEIFALAGQSMNQPSAARELIYRLIGASIEYPDFIIQ